MAGGRFDKTIGKVLPGTYINFESTRENEVIATGTRGTAIIPLPKANYGPAKKYIKLTTASPDAQSAAFGYSIYDSDPNRQMLLLREAFKRATTVYAYILTEGKKASAEIEMQLPEPEESEVAAAVNAAVEQYLGVKEDLTGCTLNFDKAARKLTMTLTGPITGVKNTGLIDTLTALVGQGLTVALDGTTVTSTEDVMGTELFTKLAGLEEGDEDVTFSITVSKGDVEEAYTGCVSYPAAESAGTHSVTPRVSGDTNTLTAVAKYGGSRGNDFTVTVDANPLGGYDVIIHLAGDKMAEYEGLYTIEELIALDNPYLDFAGSGDLGEAVGTNLSGGDDSEVSNADITDFVDTWESVKFNTVAFPFDGEEATNIKQAAITKIKYMREDMGKGVQVVIPNAGAPDYEGVLNVTNSVALDNLELTTAEACAWVAGATAGASMTESLTYVKYDGATSVVNPKTNEEAVEAVKKGEFFFVVNEDEEIVAQYDINSLVTFGDQKDSSYRKNRVIRVFDTLQETIQLNFPPNKFDNEETGWNIMEGIGKSILRDFENQKAITNVDYDSDFKVDREASYDDMTYFDVGIQAVDSAEKLYFTIHTR